MKNAGMFNLVLLAVFIALIYFMMIRPQRRRDKEIKDMRAALKPGDEIVTVGGIVGKIVSIKEDVIVIETGARKTKLEMLKSSIGSVTKQGSKAKAEVEIDEAEEAAAPVKAKKVTPKKLGAKKVEAEAVETETTEETEDGENAAE